MDHLYIFLSITIAVTGQLMVKWRMSLLGALPAGFTEKIIFLLKALLDPFIIMSLFCTFAAGLLWMAAMTKFEISYAYPFLSFSFILVLIFSSFFLGEPITIQKILGLALIVVGIFISTR